MVSVSNGCQSAAVDIAKPSPIPCWVGWDRLPTFEMHHGCEGGNMYSNSYTW